MALWMQTQGKLYLPPSKPVAKVLTTDEYVVGTKMYFHGGTDRLLIVGHPHFDVTNGVDDKIVVPKCSGNQFRVMRMFLPDPNKFAIADLNVFNPEKERLVFKLIGLQIDRGGPLGVGATGHPLFNKYVDCENPINYPEKLDNAKDYRKDLAVDPKQVQLFIVGCAPPTGEYWDVADPCPDKPLQNGECPPIELLHSVIEDGDMCEIGFGAVNFRTFQQDRAGTPLELTNEISKWPDFVAMTKDIYGDQVFFFGKKEQMYARHLLARAGIDGDTLPTTTYLNPNRNGDAMQKDLGPYCYSTTPSGSLVTSDAQLFNRPYWLYQAQGANNGILWGNQLFITIVDNTHNTNFNLSIYNQQGPIDYNNYTYKAGDFKTYTRHVEEFDVEIIVELCKVPLDAEVLSHINVMNPQILEDWELSFVPPPPEGIQDTYRYLKSSATKCPPKPSEVTSDDPWAKYTFWNIDLREKLSSELSQFPLGKRFLYQNNMLRSRKRARVDTTQTTKSTKRKRSR